MKHSPTNRAKYLREQPQPGNGDRTSRYTEGYVYTKEGAKSWYWKWRILGRSNVLKRHRYSRKTNQTFYCLELMGLGRGVEVGTGYAELYDRILYTHWQDTDNSSQRTTKADHFYFSFFPIVQVLAEGKEKLRRAERRAAKEKFTQFSGPPSENKGGTSWRGSGQGGETQDVREYFGIMARQGGLGGVKRRKRSRRPPRNASCRMWVRGDPGRVGVEMLKLRASAARSGTRMGSVGRRWSETVAHASARRKTSHEWPLGSGTRWVRVAKAARKCGVLGNARDERTSLSSKIRGKKSAIRNLQRVA
ncbi:hypothetical protein EDB86DRAFT_2825146 [Lactarius hatsudake]|nr:hypothetical protein EDB86DRAFT_2825146 [Lactarius hatsudake]